MSFSTSWNIVVLGDGPAARPYFDALVACRIVANGTPVTIAPMIWAPTREVIAAIAGGTPPSLAGTDLAEMLDPPDIHVAIVTIDDPALVRRAVENRTHVLATAPVETMVAPARLITGIASGPEDVCRFLDGIANGTSPLPSFGAPSDPAEEIRIALAALPAGADAARTRLERALSLLEGTP